MPLTIGSNIASLGAQRQLSRASDSLGSTFERLASGQRINRAADDAAGLAVSTTLNAKSRVFGQAVRNLNDGASMLSIADSALENLGQIVTRLQELAQQAASGTYSNRQRKALDQEAQALSKEFTRMTRSTTFNGLNLLDGSLGSGVALQGGFGDLGALQTNFGDGVGVGSFQAAVTAALTTNATAIALADLNGDGKNDLVTGTSVIQIQMGNGDGTFGAASTLPILSGTPAAGDIELRDLNGDGAVDLSFSAQAGYIRTYFNDGSGTFSSGQSIGLAGSFDRPAYFEFTDLNADGWLDLTSAVGNGDTNAVLTYALGRGDGTFGATNSVAFGSSRASSLNAGDFDGNGTVDVIASTGDAAYLFRGNGQGSFAAPTTLVGSSQIFTTLVQDIDGNGTADLITSDLNTGIYVYTNDGSGTFTFSRSFDERLGGSGGSNHALQISDLNSDGNVDLIATGRTESANNAQISVLLGQGGGAFAPAITIAAAASAADDYGLTLAIGDINNDGGLDIIAGGYFNNGSAGFLSIMLANVGTGVSTLEPFSLQTQVDARDAMRAFDTRSNRLAAQRGTIGAFQSRLEVASRTLSTTRDVSREASARITDVDVAQESAELVRKQIIQQAGSAVLRQANLQPEIALQLLRGT